jgi:hypothetical protein
VFQLDGEPESSSQVFQVRRDVRQAVFSCKLGFKNANDRSSLSRPTHTQSQKREEKKNKKERKKERRREKGYTSMVFNSKVLNLEVATFRKS